MDYVTYDASGHLTGGFSQDLVAAHAGNHIAVTADQRANWVLYQANAARTGVEPVTAPVFDLAAASAALIVKIDSDVDAVYQAVIGNRSDEYTQANIDALAFKAAGYSGSVPASVASWAAAKAWTAQAATDDILLAAARLSALRDTIRAQRLSRKEGARLAANQAALSTVAAQWAGSLAAIRAAAGL